MKISKKDSLMWFEFFASLPEDEELMSWQMEIVYAVFAQIEDVVEHRRSEMMSQIPNLKTMEDRTYYVGDENRFPKGCISCLFGSGLNAVRKTNRCNLECKFCYDYGELKDQPPIGENYWEIGGTKFREEDLDLLFKIQEKPTGIAYVYLEPFLEIDKYYGVIRKFHNAGVYQHLYTNGTLATEENLKKLADAGLDELRFNLGATNCADSVIEKIGIAKQYIPSVGIETPMTPEFYDSFMDKKQDIFNTGVDFMNCAELHLNPNNIENYEGEEMYVSRQGYLSPIFSRDLTLKMMKTASENKWPLTVHDCSDRTKFARDLNLRGKEGDWFGASGYAFEFDQVPYWAFLPVLQDPDFLFLSEEPLPAGYRPGDIESIW